MKYPSLFNYFKKINLPATGDGSTIMPTTDYPARASLAGHISRLRSRHHPKTIQPDISLLAYIDSL